MQAGGPCDQAVRHTPRTRKATHTMQSSACYDSATQDTDMAPLRSNIAAAGGHKPPRHIHVTKRGGQQKGCEALLVTARDTFHHAAHHHIDRSPRRIHASSTNISSRSHVASTSRHKPPCHVDVTFGACREQGRETSLLTSNAHQTHADHHIDRSVRYNHDTDIVPLRSNIAAGL